MAEQLDDTLVIQMILQGQRSAYATLVNKYQSYVFTLTMRYVNNRELAEELAQDVFVKAFRYLADFKGDSKFSTWLYTIVNSTCLSHLRKKKDATILLEEEKMISISDSNSGEYLKGQLEQKTQQQLLEAAIRQLNPIDAQVITLFYLAEQTLQEIATITNQPVTNIKVRLFRARQKLRDILEKKYSKEL